MLCQEVKMFKLREVMSWEKISEFYKKYSLAGHKDNDEWKMSTTWLHSIGQSQESFVTVTESLDTSLADTHDTWNVTEASEPSQHVWQYTHDMSPSWGRHWSNVLDPNLESTGLKIITQNAEVNAGIYNVAIISLWISIIKHIMSTLPICIYVNSCWLFPIPLDKESDVHSIMWWAYN